MQQHPVPQQISSYEFKLVGDMTLKQFFQIAGGGVVALLIYASPLPGIIKWPLMLLSAFLGIVLAFIPVEERPFSAWIASFFKAVYSPTQYEWVPGASEEVFAKGAKEAEIIAPGGEEKALEYLKSIPLPKILSAFEEAEEKFFDYVQGLFHSIPSPPSATSSGQAPTPQTQPFAVPQVEEVPTAPPVKVELQPPSTSSGQAAQQPAYTPQGISPVLTSQQGQSQATQAKFTPEAAPPSPPEIANTIVGQVLTPEGKIIEGAILEVKDSGGLPVRALKSSKVGHFMTATPLPDGEYRIEIEKDGFVFDNVKFPASGGIIPPIEIRAKSTAVN